jgi:hypothetical protein
MANPYATWAKDIRRTAQQAWTVARSNLANIGLDYVVEALEKIIDHDAADGTLLSTVGLSCHVSAPLKLVVAHPGSPGRWASGSRLTADGGCWATPLM